MSTNPSDAASTAKPTDAIPGVGPLIDQARSFAKARPFAAATLAGVVGLAILNTLRGKS